MMTKYKVKLPNNPEIKDYIKFFSAIPANEWCVDLTENEKGQRCAHGHMNAAMCGRHDSYFGSSSTWPANLVDVNNGIFDSFYVKDRSKGIKARVIKYLKSLLK